MTSLTPEARRALLHARVGTVLSSRWRLDALLGIGGAAAVYAATHRAGTRVAIKIAHREVAEQPTELERFRREPYLANRVTHPAVVRVFDDGVTPDGLPFFVMELLEGEVIGSSVHRGEPRPLLDVIDIARTVLSVLEVAHPLGVVHRDLKPSNLFRCGNGQLKVLDFGIARGLALNDLTLSGMLLGTPAFMAPEQALAQRERIGPPTDLFAVGASALVLLKGARLREGNELVLASIEPLPSAAAMGVRGPRGVLEVFERAVAFAIEDRWRSAAEMRHALETAARALPAHVLRGEPLADDGVGEEDAEPPTMRQPLEGTASPATQRDPELPGGPTDPHTVAFLLERKVTQRM